MKPLHSRARKTVPPCLSFQAIDLANIHLENNQVKHPRRVKFVLQALEDETNGPTCKTPLWHLTTCFTEPSLAKRLDNQAVGIEHVLICIPTRCRHSFTCPCHSTPCHPLFFHSLLLSSNPSNQTSFRLLPSTTQLEASTCFLRSLPPITPPPPLLPTLPQIPPSSFPSDPLSAPLSLSFHLSDAAREARVAHVTACHRPSHVALKLSWVAAQHLRCLLVQRVVGVRVLRGRCQGRDKAGEGQGR